MRLFGVIFSDAVEDHFNVLGETHVEHLIGLIENSNFAARKIQIFALHVINDTSRSADKDVYTRPESTSLRTVGDTTVEKGGEEAKRFGNTSKLLLNLTSKLAGRAKDNHGYRTAPPDAAVGVHVSLSLSGLDDTMDCGQTKGEGLTGSGPTSADNVTTGTGRSEGLSLNRRQVCDALF